MVFKKIIWAVEALKKDLWKQSEGPFWCFSFSIIASPKVGVNEEGLTGINEAAAKDPKLYQR